MGTSLEGHVDESCRLATLVYVNIVLRELHYSFSLLKVLKRKLMHEHELCEQSGVPITDKASMELLLWSLCVGAVLALDGSEEDWFAARIAKAAGRTELAGWREVEECLRRVLWAEKMSDGLRAGVWRRVEGWREQSRR